jgi:serine/threonine protein kinase
VLFQGRGDQVKEPGDALDQVDAENPCAPPLDGSQTEPLASSKTDPMFEAMDAWEKAFALGQDKSPEELVSDPSLIDALRERIRRQKRVYAMVRLPEAPPADATSKERPLPAFPGHEVVAEIGHGGMGVVFKALDVRLGRPVAIKTIAESRWASREQVERFLNEARAIARLRHENIIPIHAIAEHDGRPYITLELAEGGNLAQFLAETPLAPALAAELVAKLARAVHYAHVAGVVHRDLKPSNVLLTADGVPKVSDFGLARLLDADSTLTGSGQPIGTPSYMAPEQAKGRSKEVGPAADIYALGAILYQALTTRPPFLGSSAVETLNLVMSTQVVPPRQSRPEVPRDLETICLKCLEKQPIKRYTSASDLAEDLRRFLERRPIAARPVSSVEHMWRWCLRNPVVAMSVAAVFAILLISSIVSAAWAIRATRAENRAQSEAAIASGISGFLQNDLLGRASPYNQSGIGARPDPDLKLRTVLDLASRTVGQRFAENPLVDASIRLTLGETYAQLGLYRPALEHLHRAVELRSRMRGDEHPETMIARNRLGNVYLADQRLQEAEPLLVAAMEGLRRTLGPEHPEALAAANGVAVLHAAQGKLDESERLFLKVLETRRRVVGPDHDDTLETMVFLAELRQIQGDTIGPPEAKARDKYADAEALLTETLDAYQRRGEAEHPAALLARTYLAVIYNRLGRKTDADRLVSETLGVQRKVLGNKHPETLATMAHLGEMYWTQGKLKESESILREALEGCRSALDRNHETTEAALAGLTAVYSMQKDMARLGEVLIEVREVTSSRRGPHDHLTFVATWNLVLFYLGQGEHAKAERYIRESVQWLIEHKPDDLLRRWAESCLGLSLLGQKNYDEAKRLLFSAYAGMKARETTMDPVARGNLAATARWIAQLCHETGAGRDDNDFARFRTDPVFQATLLDLQFPAEPFEDLELPAKPFGQP